jgi:hypothetical protein
MIKMSKMRSFFNNETPLTLTFLNIFNCRMLSTLSRQLTRRKQRKQRQLRTFYTGTQAPF